MEKIIKIEKRSFWYKSQFLPRLEADGYCIETDRRNIYFGINNCQQCCEYWGYLTSEDDLSRFEGAVLFEISSSNTAMKTVEMKLKDDNITSSDLVFINVLTNKGVLQFTAYNEHNGYYGHDVVCFSVDKQGKREVIVDECI